MSKIIYGFEIPESTLRGSRKGEGNASDFDDNDYNSTDGSGHDSDSLNEDPRNGDDIKAWDLSNEHFFSV